ncbi:MoaD/ThiS family protein [Thermodesulfovibrio hydrogeniphilus]
MKVIVKLFGGLTTLKDFQKTEEGDIIFETSEPLTLGDLITSLSLNKKPFIIILNGIIQNELSVSLKDGDEISLFPPIAGGK